ncbi:SgcJ/EcaC family oxidoreductase [Paenibacillus filicis]|uniref:SgcJ/EcaC family oxidoreductase n=1 Tax=Paenibacillus gyeongsangnamensis TaxID=3388067 RepID=A0ABT4Q8T0_9BACL|nr:SgcJ/EcaC family oxidoreductase [Paenibacillus filicis]MCZ8513272.1 SgcJ/EcaC family oxidoreductase [Paenibacillus filicis]
MIMNPSVSNEVSDEVQALYRRLLKAWNDQDARAMADQFTEDGESIGFDGSQSIGREEIYSHLKPIFEDHPTARFVSIVKNVRHLGTGVVMLRAIAGMVPRGQSDLQPKLNTQHTVVAVQGEGRWRIQLFQNTPAQFHGRPELVEQMTEELRERLSEAAF